MTNLIFEHYVPQPKTKRVTVKERKPRVLKWEENFQQLDVANRNSFFVPVEGTSENDLEKLRGRLRSATFNYAKRHRDFAFSVVTGKRLNAETGEEQLGVRVVRVDPAQVRRRGEKVTVTANDVQQVSLSDLGLTGDDANESDDSL